MTDYLLEIARQLDAGPQGRPTIAPFGHDGAADDGATAWHEPEGMWKPKIGDRVECRPSPECRLVSSPGTLQGDAGDVGHEAWETGLTGVVENVLTDDGDDRDGEPELVAQGHVWEVLWDRPHLYAAKQCWGAAYALGELLPLDDAAAATARPSDDVGRRPTFAPRQGPGEG